MQTSVSAAPREVQETQLDPEWIAARQASLEIAAREASLVEARRRAERGPSYRKELEQALASSRAQHQEAAKSGPSSLEAEVAALEAEIAALQAGHTIVAKRQELPAQDPNVVPQAGPAHQSRQVLSSATSSRLATNWAWGPLALCTRHCGRATWSLLNRSAAIGWKTERARRRTS